MKKPKIWIVYIISLFVFIFLAFVVYPFYKESLIDAESVTQCKLLSRLIKDAFLHHSCDVKRDYENDIQQDGKLIIKNTEGKFVNFRGNPIFVNISKADKGFMVEVRSTWQGGYYETRLDVTEEDIRNSSAHESQKKK